MREPRSSAGWYADPWFPTQRRFWNGGEWTGHTAPVPPPQPHGRLGRWRQRRGTELTVSRDLVDATYAMLFADRWMIGLMFAGSLLAAVAGLAIVAPTMLWSDVTPGFSVSSSGLRGVLVAGAALGVTGFVTQLTTGAVVGAAVLRAVGSTPTLRGALGIAWSRRRQILAWAAVSTLVGALIRLLERLGVGGVVAALTLNVGWAAATVFSMPVVIIEGTMPVETVRRSARVLKDNFGTTVFGGVRLALPWIVIQCVALCVGVLGGLLLAFATAPRESVLGAVLLAVGALGTVFCVVVTAALGTYLQTNLYRYATGASVPGVDPSSLPRLAG